MGPQYGTTVLLVPFVVGQGMARLQCQPRMSVLKRQMGMFQKMHVSILPHGGFFVAPPSPPPLYPSGDLSFGVYFP